MASRPGGGDAAIALAEFVNRPQSVWVKSAMCLTAVLHFRFLRCVVSTNKKNRVGMSKPKRLMNLLFPL
jgi:hypothetical protein